MMSVSPAFEPHSHCRVGIRVGVTIGVGVSVGVGVRMHIYRYYTGIYALLVGNYGLNRGEAIFNRTNLVARRPVAALAELDEELALPRGRAGGRGDGEEAGLSMRRLCGGYGEC